MATQSKLAVILHADVAGSTALVQKDERQAHRRIQDTFERLSKSISAYGGRPHEMRGDALVALFSKASDAVSAALAFHQHNPESDSWLSGELQPQLRIGIALGEVVVGDATITGAGVIVAQRLEQLAQGGEVVLQGAVAEVIPNRFPFDYTSLGEQQLKGFDTPIRACTVAVMRGQVLPSPEAQLVLDEDRAAQGAPPPQSKPSIAVMPLLNMALRDNEHEVLADGLTDDLITALSRLHALFVIARNSSFTFRGQQLDAREIAWQLGVQYLLEGTMRSVGPTLRINAQLIDAPRNRHVWADTYEFRQDSFHGAQDEFIRSVVASVQTQITLHEGEVEWEKPRPSPNNDCRLKRAWSSIYRCSGESLTQAITLADEVIASEPNSSTAYQVRAIGLHHLAYLGLVSDWQTAVLDANEAAQKAVDLFERDEYSHWILGSTFVLLRQHSRAVAEYHRAIEINPNCSLAYGSLGTALAWAGKGIAAIESNDIAIRSNPRDPLIFLRFFVRALAHFTMDDFAESIEWIEKCLSRNRIFLNAHLLRIACYGLLDSARGVDEAKSNWRRAFPEASVSDGHFPFLCEKDLNNLQQGLNRAGL